MLRDKFRFLRLVFRRLSAHQLVIFGVLYRFLVSLTQMCLARKTGVSKNSSRRERNYRRLRKLRSRRRGKEGEGNARKQTRIFYQTPLKHAVL